MLGQGEAIRPNSKKKENSFTRYTIPVRSAVNCDERTQTQMYIRAILQFSATRRTL